MLNGHFKNISGKTVTPTASLVQVQTFLTENRRRQLVFHCTHLSQTVRGEPVPSGCNGSWENLELKIPVTSPDISNCDLIKVKHQVVVGERTTVFKIL